MKWFKHYSDNYKGKSVQFLFDELGHFGVAGYFILLEMCAEKLEQKSDESLTEVDLLFSFHQRIVRQNLRTSQTNLRRLLDICQTLGLLTFEVTQDLVEIKMPILLNLLDRDQKKPRLNRVTTATNKRLDKNRLDKIRVEENKNLPASKKSEPNPLNSQVWESYKSAYFQRYKVEPVRNAKVNSNISQIAKRLGIEAIEVVKFYLTHNDSFYLKNLHAVSLCLKDCESLRTQMVRGRTVTSNDVRNFEKQQNTFELQKAVRDGENF